MPRAIMSTLRNHTPRPVRVIIIVAVIYAFCWVKGWPKYYDDEELPPSQRPRLEIYGGPHTVDHDQLIVSITSTATEVYAKVPPTLVFTAEEDHGQLLLFADLQMEIGKWPVFDVLWRYPHKFVMEARELGRYRAQVDYARKSLPMQNLRKQDEKEEKEIQNMLDKYKILQTMAAAWEYRPDRSWYVFVGDETWINRANLRDWLSQYDPKSRHFFGNPPIPEFPDPFATGGTTVILSGQVMQELFSKESKEHKGFIKKWQDHIADHTSAFDLVSNVMRIELKVELQGAWPVISGFDPSTVPFSPSLWCEPVAIMHHVTPDIASDLWKFEKERGADHLSNAPLRIADLWQRFMTPENLNDTRKDWDNLSSEPSNSRWNILFEGDKPEGGRAKSGEESPEACEDSCRQSEFCMQWSYSSLPQPNWNTNPQTRCHLSSSIRFGTHKAPQDMNVQGEDTKLTWTIHVLGGSTTMQTATSTVVSFLNLLCYFRAVQRQLFVIYHRKISFSRPSSCYYHTALMLTLHEATPRALIREIQACSLGSQRRWV
ncbi:glycosyltransferase family 31 protein [Plenodomus tracheiphilus IPT5]|uniref:Glycosyltransferase family 31 protein n=1 Tax=Plenodomus tracheiphilus IPT5 TaxID=1408161 RepID=A0A6A7AQT8_9PLEO|nr:glycosyltransferase family 31 protein [Plenodomus tracheiphilus IPT5]